MNLQSVLLVASNIGITDQINLIVNFARILIALHIEIQFYFNLALGFKVWNFLY